MDKIKAFYNKNKKIIISVAIILALLIAVGIYFVSQPNEDTNTKTENQIEEKVDISTEEQNADKAQDDAKVDEAPVKTPADKPSADAPASKPADKPAGNGNAGSASGNTGSSKPTTPSHTHTWKNHTATKQVWVSNIVPVYETQRVQVGTKRVSEGFFWHCNCGAVIPKSEARSHAKAHLMAGQPSNGYTKEHFREEPVYENQQVQVGTRDDGHYETQSYTDYQYCDCGAKRELNIYLNTNKGIFLAYDWNIPHIFSYSRFIEM